MPAISSVYEAYATYPTDGVIAPYSRFTANGTDELRVPFAQATFDAEGQEIPGRFFSRAIHFPGGSASGVTIGRGYDLGGRNSAEVIRDMQHAGVPLDDARTFARAVGLRGARAAAFMKQFGGTFPTLSLSAQRKLFTDVSVPQYTKDIIRIFEKQDVVSKYGRANWNTLPAAAQELVFDLRYRGDYTSTVRRRLQPLLVEQDMQGLRSLVNDREFWASLGVPAGRIEARIAAFSNGAGTLESGNRPAQTSPPSSTFDSRRSSSF